MLSEKLCFLLDLLNTDNTEISRCAGCSPSNISRLKSGARLPPRTSPTISKLADGICAFADSSGTIELLCLVVGTGNSADIKKQLIEWLFDDRPPQLPRELSSIVKRDKAAVFGKKLDALMKLADVTNSRLSKALSIDASYISRFRRGERVPKAGSKLMFNISSALASKLIEQNKLGWLGELLSFGEPITEQNAASQIVRWLSSGIDSDVLAVRQLIECIKVCPSDFEGQIPEFEDIVTENVLNDVREVYKGSEGLRNAMVKFIGTAVRSGSRELWMYSDRDLQWLSGEYRPIWLSLINQCVKSGIKLKLIHNCEIKASELLSAINSWLPLYISGLIEPYYCIKKGGDRFVHTIFIDPDRGCVVSCCVKGFEDMCNYYYLTDDASISFHQSSFAMLLAESRSIMNYTLDQSRPDNILSAYTLDDSELIICEDRVVLNTLIEPKASFVFTQPQICRAFREYAEEILDK